MAYNDESLTGWEIETLDWVKSNLDEGSLALEMLCEENSSLPRASM